MSVKVPEEGAKGQDQRRGVAKLVERVHLSTDSFEGNPKRMNLVPGRVERDPEGQCAREASVEGVDDALGGGVDLFLVEPVVGQAGDGRHEDQRVGRARILGQPFGKVLKMHDKRTNPHLDERLGLAQVRDLL